MFDPGNLYYFKPFYFQDGTYKRKYFLSLYSDENSIIIASLPSSVDYVPNHIEKAHGCLNDLPSDFNAYYCSPEIKITTNGWRFPTHTYLYGQWVNLFQRKELEENYQIEGVDYELIGCLKPEEFKAIIRCFLAARTLKNKIRKILAKPR